jgi:O-antigen ligase
VLRIAEAGLNVAVCIAVLAFGGTAPRFFLVTQLVVLGLGVFLLSASLRSPRASIRFPFAAPLVLIVLVLLQILPFPASLAPLFGALRDGFPGRTRFTLSVAPYQTVSHFLLLVTYLTAFYLVLSVCRDRNAKKRLVYVLIALGMFEAFYGLLQYLTGWQQIFTYAKKYYLEEATGTYINRNHFAGLLEMILPFAVVLALRQARALRRAALRGEAPARSVLSAPELLPLVFWLFLAAAIFTALIFSRSRMGLISALFSLIAVLALAGTSPFSARTRVAVATLFFLGVIGLVVWIGSDPVITRFETLGQEYSQTGQNRISIWRDTLRLIRQHPLIGTGLGTFSVAYPSVQTSFLNVLVDHAHCDYLEVISDLGLPGGILAFGSILWVLAQAVRHYGEAGDRFDTVVCLGCVGSIAAILVHGLADFNLYIPANTLVLTVILALAWSSIHEVKISGRPAPSILA